MAEKLELLPRLLFRSDENLQGPETLNQFPLSSWYDPAIKYFKVAEGGFPRRLLEIYSAFNLVPIPESK